MLSVPERVARGVQWLDENRPDWVARVEIKAFNIMSHCRCVLGLVFNDDAEAAWDSEDWRHPDGFTYATDKYNIENASDLGFDAQSGSVVYTNSGEVVVYTVPEDFKALQAEWVRVIDERQVLA